MKPAFTITTMICLVFLLCLSINCSGSRLINLSSETKAVKMDIVNFGLAEFIAFIGQIEVVISASFKERKLLRYCEAAQISKSTLARFSLSFMQIAISSTAIIASAHLESKYHTPVYSVRTT